jgi:hypothetical protein
VCVHEWAFGGAAAVDDAQRLVVGCEWPYNLVCKVCSEVRLARCGRSSARYCGPCSKRGRARVQRVAGSGVVVGVEGLFLTITAPSWREHFNRWGSACRCTGGGHDSLAEWNATAGKRFNRLMRDLGRWLGRCAGCRARLRRGERKRYRCPECPGDVRLVYFKGAEVQQRGALHFHWLIRRADAVPLRVSVAELRWLALRHGFGHSVDVAPIADHHAGYVAKYVAKSAGDRPDVPWDGMARFERLEVDHVTGECERVKGWRRSTRPSYRTWSKSRAWGDSMRCVRARQGHHEAVLACLRPWADGRTVWPAEADGCWAVPAVDRRAGPHLERV